MINTVSRDRGQLQGLLRTVGEAQNAHIQRIAERVRHVNTATSGRSGELFDEVGDAFTALVDQVDDHVAGRPFHQLSQQFSDLCTLQIGQIDPYGAWEAPHFGQERTQRMPAGEFVAAW